MAPIIVKDEIMISKDRAKIWTLLTDISSWSRWSRIIKRAAIYGPLKPGTEFKCIAGDWDFDGVISKVTPQENFVLNGKSIGLRLHIVWEIHEQEKSTKVTAAITPSGWIASIFKRKTKKSLEDNLFTWLYALKTTVERGEKPEEPSRPGLSKPKRRFALPGPLNFLFKRREEDE